MFKIIYSQKTDQGKFRKNNEDAMLVEDPKEPAGGEKKGVLLAVADGLGGLEHGEVASSTAVSELGRLFKKLTRLEDPRWLLEAFRQVNEKIYDMNQKVSVGEWMATTLTASLFFKDRLTIGHVGDSRMYIVRAGGILQLTTDHSVDRYTLTRVIGTDPEAAADLYALDIQENDIYIQCSDGLYSMVSDEEMLGVVARAYPEESCERLVDLANERGGTDNITVQVIRVLR